MSEQELRRILDEVIRDLDAGRVDLRPSRRRIGRWLGPPIVAATLGLTGAAGCEDRAVGAHQDAALDAGSTELYGVAEPDAAVDGGNVDLYGVIVEPDAAVDGGNVDLYGVVVEDAGVVDAGLVDAALDGEIPLPYGVPPLGDAGPSE